MLIVYGNTTLYWSSILHLNLLISSNSSCFVGGGGRIHQIFYIEDHVSINIVLSFPFQIGHLLFLFALLHWLELPVQWWTEAVGMIPSTLFFIVKI